MLTTQSVLYLTRTYVMFRHPVYAISYENVGHFTRQSVSYISRELRYYRVCAMSHENVGHFTFDSVTYNRNLGHVNHPVCIISHENVGHVYHPVYAISQENVGHFTRQSVSYISRELKFMFTIESVQCLTRT